MSTLGDAADVNAVIKFLPHMLNVCGRNLITGLTSPSLPKLDISSTCKVGQKNGVSLPVFTCSPSAWPSRLPYHRGRKSRKDLWITLYIKILTAGIKFLKDKPNLWALSLSYTQVLLQLKIPCRYYLKNILSPLKDEQWNVSGTCVRIYGLQMR